jgi:hypothetical protein
LIKVFTHANGNTGQADRVDPAWLAPGSGVLVWVDLMNPSPEEGRGMLKDVFHFHDLAVDDALSSLHHGPLRHERGSATLRDERLHDVRDPYGHHDGDHGGHARVLPKVRLDLGESGN